MKKVDKVLLGTLLPVVAVVIVVTVVLALAASCPEGKIWDFGRARCRAKCSKGQEYNSDSDTCACGGETPVFNAVTQQCEGKCDAGKTWNAATGKCDPPPLPSCTPPPSVNASTGAIQDATHFLREGGTCDTGSTAELQQLCQRSMCSLPDVCVDGDRWDGFDGEKCFKRAGCALDLCDAGYCTSATVVQKLGRIKKVANAEGKCVNVREADVAAWCSSLPGSKYVAPECVTVTPQAVLTLSVDSGSTVDSIEGTVSHPLVNGAIDLTAGQTLPYQYALNGTNVWSQVEVGKACAAGAPPGGVCSTFHIKPQGLSPGTYLLDMRGFPAWDSSLPLYTLSAPVSVSLTGGGGAAPQEVDALRVKFDTEAAQQVAANTSLVNQKLAVLHDSYPNLVLPQLEKDTSSLAFKPGVQLDQPLLVSCLSSYCKSDENVNFKLVVLAWRPVEPVACGSAKFVKYVLKKHVASADKKGVIEDVLVGPSEAQGQPPAAEIKGGIVSILDLVRLNEQVTYYLGSYMVDSPSAVTDYDTSSCKSPWFQAQVNVGAYTAEFCQQIPVTVANAVPPYMSLSSNGTCTWDTTDASRDFYCTFAWPGTTESPKDPGLHPTQLALYNQQQGCAYVQPSVPQFNPVNTWTSPTCAGSSVEEGCFAGEKQTVSVKCSQTVKLAGTSEEKSKSDLQTRLAAMVTGAPYYNYDNFDMSAILNDKHDTVDMGKVWDGNYYSCGPETAPSAWGNDAAGCGGRADTAENSVCKTLAQNANCGGLGKNYCQSWQGQSGEYTRFRRCYRDVAQANNCGEEREKRKLSPCCDESCMKQELSECCNCRGTFVLDPNAPNDNRGYCVCGPRYAGARCEEDVCGNAFPGNTPECSPDNSTSTGCCVAHLGARCQEFKTQDLCPTQSGECQWKADAQQCVRTDVCSKYKTAGTCNNLDCRWNDNEQVCEGVRFKCVCNDNYFRVAEARPMDMVKDCKFFTKGTIATMPYSPDPGNSNASRTSTCDPMKTVGIWDGSQYAPTLFRNENCMIDPYTCKCPQPCQLGDDPAITQCLQADPYVCRRNNLAKNASPRADGDGTVTNVNPLTGCVDQCNQHIPIPGQQYKYYNPEVNDFRCRSCTVGGKHSCQELQTTLKDKRKEFKYLQCFQSYLPPNMGKVPQDPSCLEYYDMDDSVYQNPTQYCPDCCFYNCKKHKDYHRCDNGGFPPY